MFSKSHRKAVIGLDALSSVTGPLLYLLHNNDLLQIEMHKSPHPKVPGRLERCHYFGTKPKS